MHSPEDLVASPSSDTATNIQRVLDCPAPFFRYLYAEVGRLYHWIDRLPWTDSQIRTHVARPEITLWVLYRNGAPAGYFELERHEDGSTELAYFGLMQNYIGGGFGKYLLTEAVQKAWAHGANRVWLHTCSLDDPAALPNYIKRGFKPFKQETYLTTISPEEELVFNRSAAAGKQPNSAG